MTPVVHSVLATTPVDDIAKLMTQRHIHRVIVRREMKVVGIISALDVLRVFGGTEKAKAVKPKAAAKPKAKPRGSPKIKAQRPRRRRAA